MNFIPRGTLARLKPHVEAGTNLVHAALYFLDFSHLCFFPVQSWNPTFCSLLSSLFLKDLKAVWFERFGGHWSFATLSDPRKHLWSPLITFDCQICQCHCGIQQNSAWCISRSLQSEEFTLYFIFRGAWGTSQYKVYTIQVYHSRIIHSTLKIYGHLHPFTTPYQVMWLTIHL